MDKDLQGQLNKLQKELEMLYEISNIMRSTLKLEETLYIILTAVTSHEGLGFNRAMLFLLNEKEQRLEGKMGIGPDSAEDAHAIWTYIEKHKIGLDELIEPSIKFEHLKKSKLNQTVKGIRIPLSEDSGIIALSALEGMTFVINTPEQIQKINPELIHLLGLENFVVAPLKAKDKIIGLILADNKFDKKPIASDDIHMLTMFANQAGLAIENSQLYERTLILSNTDSLTGLWNHGYFQHLLGEEIKRASSNKSSISLLMIDLDNFKTFNDTFGHQAGDAILKEVGRIFREVSRKIDIISRYGGEEFAIILPDTRKDEASILAERLRKAIETSTSLKNITISIGISTYPEDGEDKETLLLYADKALYQAKREGKNRVILASHIIG